MARTPQTPLASGGLGRMPEPEKNEPRSGASVTVHTSASRPKQTRSNARVEVGCGANQNRSQAVETWSRSEPGSRRWLEVAARTLMSARAACRTTGYATDPDSVIGQAD